MTDSTVSVRLLDDVLDILRDNEPILKQLGINASDVSEGLIWRKFSQAQKKFMEEWKTTRITYYYALFPNQEYIQLPENCVLITNIEYNRDELDPDLKYPVMRNGVTCIQILTPEDLQIYDVMTVEMFIKPYNNAKINRQTSPFIEETYHDLLVDWVLSDYIKIPGVKSKEQIEAEIEKKKMTLLGVVNNVSYPDNFIQF